jgi:hypothetical protein
MNTKSILILIAGIFLFAACGKTQAQSTSRILSPAEVEQVFTDSVKQKHNIQYPIRRVYSYSDKSGEYCMALTERFDGTADGDTVHHQIKAFHFKLSNGILTKEREIYDFTIEPETSIWFWTKYFQFRDIDNDGLIEPIIVYGSRRDDFDQFRVKILIYYKNQKYAIRHSHCDLDYCRFTQIDKEFYNLPKPVIEEVKNIIRAIEENGHAYFGHWESAMEKRSTKF